MVIVVKTRAASLEQSPKPEGIGRNICISQILYGLIS